MMVFFLKSCYYGIYNTVISNITTLCNSVVYFFSNNNSNLLYALHNWLEFHHPIIISITLIIGLNSYSIIKTFNVASIATVIMCPIQNVYFLTEGLRALASLPKETLEREYWKVNSALQKKCEYIKRSLNLEDPNYLKPANKKRRGGNYCRIIENKQTQPTSLSEGNLLFSYLFEDPCLCVLLYHSIMIGWITSVDLTLPQIYNYLSSLVFYYSQFVYRKSKVIVSQLILWRQIFTWRPLTLVALSKYRKLAACRRSPHLAWWSFSGIFRNSAQVWRVGSSMG